RLAQHRHSLTTQKPVELVRRTADPVGYNDQLSTMEQGSPDFPYRKVERARVKERPNVAIVETEVVLSGCEKAENVTVSDEHTLGQPSRTRRVDEVGAILGAQIALQIRRCEARFQCVQADQCNTASCQAAAESGIRHGRDAVAVGQHQLEPVIRMQGIERNINRSAL